MAVLVKNLQEKVPVKNELVDLASKAANTVLGAENFTKAEASIVFVDNDKIAELNQQYRQVNGPTDVLSFSMLEDEPLPGESEELILGDVIISMEMAFSQAADFGHSIEREAAFLTVHGVLHLLGYDHKKVEDKKLMRKREDAIMEQLSLSR
ncbi:MAG: rRNA maturation RNase YbeY [Clostridiales bacterium]|nr:rRNA maturation RNase YbeY [Clostridiales bacterium]MCF8021442.1 rRNA maturation RNase YbeY [Clostridiales bacterium]